MDVHHIAELLPPFLSRIPGAEPLRSEPVVRERSGEAALEQSAALSSIQLQLISIYIDLLLRWNSRINLTAVRDPSEIVTRHFGESFFAARYLFPRSTRMSGTTSAIQRSSGAEVVSAPAHVVDLGSGAGFPGLPIKIWAPDVHLTLLESNFKKATFLREVVRALGLTAVDVAAVRGEDFSAQADVVTLRAVECFETILPTATRLVAVNGRLGALIGQGQVERAKELVPQMRWGKPVPIPLSSNRVLMVGCVPR